MQPPEVFCKNRYFQKFCKFHRKTHVSKSPFDKVKKETPTRLFSSKICVKFLSIPILNNICKRLFLLCGSCGATEVWCLSKKMSGVEILERVKQMIL